MSSVLDSINSKTTKTQLLDILTNLALEKDELVTSHENFKRQVVKVAKAHKESEGWCTQGFNEAMGELGLEVPSRYRRLQVDIYVDLTDESGPTEWDEDEIADVDESDVIDALLDSLASGRMDRSTATVTLESLTEKPEKLFVEKAKAQSTRSGRVSSSDNYGYYSGYNGY